MSERTQLPVKLPFVATSIVWAVRTIGLPEKSVWFQHWALDRCSCKGHPFCMCAACSDRCFAGAPGIADRLGISPRTVEDHRSALVRRQLLIPFRRERDGGRNMGYVAVIPGITLPVNLTMKAVPALRDQLDQYWASLKAGPRALEGESAESRRQGPSFDVHRGTGTDG